MADSNNALKNAAVTCSLSRSLGFESPPIAGLFFFFPLFFPSRRSVLKGAFYGLQPRCWSCEILCTKIWPLLLMTHGFICDQFSNPPVVGGRQEKLQLKWSFRKMCLFCSQGNNLLEEYCCTRALVKLPTDLGGSTNIITIKKT